MLEVANKEHCFLNNNNAIDSLALDCTESQIRDLERDEAPRTNHSRKREASSSQSAEPKRRDHSKCLNSENCVLNGTSSAPQELNDQDSAMIVDVQTPSGQNSLLEKNMNSILHQSPFSGSSVEIQKNLDCLHLTDKVPKNIPKNGCPDCSTYIAPLVHSLFNKVPPTIYFSNSGEKVKSLPSEFRKLLKWKLSTITPVLIRQTVERSGFQLTKDENDWVGIWGKHMKCAFFKKLTGTQKVNHYPGSFYLGRKDRMSQIYREMKMQYGDAEFSYFPETFIYPQDLKELKKAWEIDYPESEWIIKPPASARGTGIKVINKWNQIPKKTIVVQRYLAEPFLINETKFDLRLYVLVPTYQPLRIYIFDDGLVRFASEKYSPSSQNLSDNFMHLTNYSVNRKNATYTVSDDENIFQGHKWTIKCLWNYMRQHQIDVDLIWQEILDIVIKTIISSEGPMTQLVKKHSKSRYNCFELFGFDILIDKNLKPWLLEVNISPSLHTSSLLDMKVKSHLVKDMLNIVGFQIPDKIADSICYDTLSKYNITQEDVQNICINRTLQNCPLSVEEKTKHLRFIHSDTSEGESILDHLTADDVRYLIESEDELCRSGSFVRIFPSEMSSSYLQYFKYSHYYNVLLNAWEQKYGSNRTEGISLLQTMCHTNYHLKSCSNKEQSQIP